MSYHTPRDTPLPAPGSHVFGKLATHHGEEHAWIYRAGEHWRYSGIEPPKRLDRDRASVKGWYVGHFAEEEALGTYAEELAWLQRAE